MFLHFVVLHVPVITLYGYRTQVRDLDGTSSVRVQHTRFWHDNTGSGRKNISAYFSKAKKVPRSIYPIPEKRILFLFLSAGKLGISSDGMMDEAEFRLVRCKSAMQKAAVLFAPAAFLFHLLCCIE